MATGDQSDFQSRIAGLLPPSWFGTGVTQVDSETGDAETPVLNALIAGFAYPLAWAYTLYTYALNQMRLSTSTGVWIDRLSYDFYGDTLPRRSGESDTDYMGRVKAYFSQERLTRPGISQLVEDLTGTAPKILEFWNPLDCGGYDEGAMGYDLAGAYGDLNLNDQFLITVYRAPGAGPEVANIGGYDGGLSAYYDPSLASGGGSGGSGSPIGLLLALTFASGAATSSFGNAEYIDDAWSQIAAEDDEIYSTIANNVAAGVTAWTAIFNANNTSIAPQLYFGDVINTQDLAVMPSFF